MDGDLLKGRRFDKDVPADKMRPPWMTVT